MNISVATVEYSADKNCFIALSSGLAKNCRKDEEIHIFEASYGDGKKAYLSWSGEITRTSSQTDGTIQLNGLYASKLDIKCGEEVIMRPISSIPMCQQVPVEPLSVDDWEILERQASFVESHLLDQVRVIWQGQVLPVWVEKSICIFLRIGPIQPDVDCALLCNDTEVLVSPKIRNSFTSPAAMSPIPPVEPEMVKSHATTNQMPKPSSDINRNSKASPKKHLHDELLYGNNKMNRADGRTLIKRLSSWLLGDPITSEVFDAKPDLTLKQQLKDQSVVVPGGLNVMLRVQGMCNDLDKKDQGDISVQDKVKNKMGSNFAKQKPSPGLFLQQPSTVFVCVEDLEIEWKLRDINIPKIFFAELKKLASPKDVEQEKTTSSPSKQKPDPHNVVKSDSAVTSAATKDAEVKCVVRVVVVDRDSEFNMPQYQHTVEDLLSRQPVLKGHVVIPDLLRRQLKLDVTGRVWLKTIQTKPVITGKYHLYPVGNMPRQLSTELVRMAFHNWLNLVTDEQYPLVFFPGILIRFPLFQDLCMEMQMLMADGGSTKADCYDLVHAGNCSASVMSNFRSPDFTSGPLMPMLAYTSASSFDPILPSIMLKNLGGISQVAEKAFQHLQVCLAMRPACDAMFSSSTGLENGIMLITGMRGSGKSCLARAICRQAAELPNLASVYDVDCKPLRGKRVDTIQKILELMFEEAAWRQPSVILLDDLDHVCGAPSGPEGEMGLEALYSARVAEVVKDLVKKEIRNNTRLCVMVTCQSRGSLFASLVTSRGTHFVQEVINIPSPNKEARRDILQAILDNRTLVSQATVQGLDMDWLMCRTEGFVARDLENLVSRAIHAHMLCQGKASSGKELVLCQKDFEIALNGFTPASIRNVRLHTAGDIGWKDIGGLTEVKKTLIETLQWPSKYPDLFAHCPLRLRSGLLLYGAPGTGKTLLAGIVSRECGLNFINIKGPELLSKYIGASEQAVRDTFMRAQSAKPCILFFDEFDSLAPRRGHDNTGVTDRVVNQLLTQLDGVEGLDGVYVLAATSRPDLIDPALLRPGRLDKCLKCELPNQEDRFKILKALTRKMDLAEDVDLNHFAEKCENYTGADLKALLYNAQLEVIHSMSGKLVKGGNSQKYSTCSKSADSNMYKTLQAEGGLRLHKSLPAEMMAESDKEDRKVEMPGRKVAYIQKLEEGIVTLTEDMEEKFISQVELIRAKQYNTQRHGLGVEREAKSPLVTGKGHMVRVHQSHLLAAVSKIRPSVSEEERLKYQRIYENFTSSRGGNFGPGIPEAGKKQTLA